MMMLFDDVRLTRCSFMSLRTKETVLISSGARPFVSVSQLMTGTGGFTGLSQQMSPLQSRSVILPSSSSLAVITISQTRTKTLLSQNISFVANSLSKRFFSVEGVPCGSLSPWTRQHFHSPPMSYKSTMDHILCLSHIIWFTAVSASW